MIATKAMKVKGSQLLQSFLMRVGPIISVQKVRMPYAWLFLVGLVVILLLYGDTRSRHSMYIPKEKSAAIQYKKWPVWNTLEPRGDRIRMLWILHDYVPFVNAGSEICAHTINRYCMSKPYKYDVWVASPGYPKRTYDGVRCFDLYDSETLNSVLESTQILHSHSYYYRKQLLYLCRITGKPFVEWVHTDNYVRAVGKMWEDKRCKGRQWTVFNSHSLRDTRKDLSETQTQIVLPAVDYRAYNVERKESKYITLSNVNENKGGYILVQLAKALPEYEFLGIMGGYRKQIIIQDIPNLRYIQHTTEIKDIYAQTEIMIMPSKEETWGRTAVEAMSSGIPVVASPTPGLKECCGSAAIYCDRADLDAWVSTLRKLKTDKEFYNMRSAAALQRARALDPNPELEVMESWLEKSVLPSATTGRALNVVEKNLLFR